MDELMKNILYITYDGLTDPLGQSQILPYLKGLSRLGYRFTILSFEKKERYEKERALIEQLTSESGIKWVPMMFTSSPPLLSKFYDAVQMRRKAFALQKETGFDMVHCRSYIAADVGLRMKKRFGTRFFFDMRGFWADEKKDGGSWNQANPIFRRVYRYYKNKEQAYLQHADYVISLTEAGKREMMKWPYMRKDLPLQVIPCCADMNHFSLTSAGEKAEARRLLALPPESFVVSYLGSVGTWYMLDEMLQLFAEIKRSYPNARFLFLTHTDRSVIESRVQQMGLSADDFLIRQASRKEVPVLMKASDINISFIKAVYSKISSSPTKLGEVLSMGIPVIANSGVGDVQEIIEATRSGFVLDGFSPSELRQAVAAIPSLLQREPRAIREAAAAVYDLEQGIAKYAAAYQNVFA